MRETAPSLTLLRLSPRRLPLASANRVRSYLVCSLRAQWLTFSTDVDENGEGSAKKKEATPSKGKKAEAANDNGKGGNIKDNEEGGGLKGEDGDDDDDF